MSSPTPFTLLHNSWTLWYHHPENNDWGVDSYQEIGSFHTVEEFWAIMNHFKESQFHLGMFFIMRDTIHPTWEDEANRNGGCWSFRIGRRDIFPAWTELSVALIGETICSQDPLSINGISISPKKGFCIMKIWNKDYTPFKEVLESGDKESICQKSSEILGNIPYLVMNETMYKSFQEKEDGENQTAKSESPDRWSSRFPRK